MDRLGERRRDLLAVAVMEMQAQITRCFGMQQWCVLFRRCAGRCDGRQRLDIDEDGFGCILGLLGGISHHHCNRFADIAHAIRCQRTLRRPRCRRAITMLSRRGRHVANSGGIKVRGGNDGLHAWHVARQYRIDPADVAMRNSTAYHHAIKLVRAVQVIGVSTLAAQQDGVFLA